MRLEERCGNISCPDHQYFCHPMVKPPTQSSYSIWDTVPIPQGCIGKTSPCHGRCLPRKELGGQIVACGEECIGEYQGRTQCWDHELISDLCPLADLSSAVSVSLSLTIPTLRPLTASLQSDLNISVASSAWIRASPAAWLAGQSAPSTSLSVEMSALTGSRAILYQTTSSNQIKMFIECH